MYENPESYYIPINKILHFCTTFCNNSKAIFNIINRNCNQQVEVKLLHTTQLQFNQSCRTRGPFKQLVTLKGIRDSVTKLHKGEGGYLPKCHMTFIALFEQILQFGTAFEKKHKFFLQASNLSFNNLDSFHTKRLKKLFSFIDKNVTSQGEGAVLDTWRRGP